MSCEFDRQRGQFVVHAGARAGACAVLTAAVLAIGTFGFVRSALFHGGPSAATAAVAPPLASTTRAVAPTTKSPATERPQKLSAPSSSAAKVSKPAKTETPVVSSTPTPTQTLAKAKLASQKKTADDGKSDGKSEHRQAGMKYLIVKNLKTRASAEKAREVLLRKGVATTVERNLPGQSAEARYSLVCLTGFDPDSDRAKLDKQVKRLKALNLDPKPVTWRG